MQLLAIQFDERLSRRDAIAEIGEHATNDAVDLGRHRDLVLGSQRANHLEGASNRLLANRVRLDGLDGLLRPAGLFGARVCTSGCHHRRAEHDQYEGTHRHKSLILAPGDIFVPTRVGVRMRSRARGRKPYPRPIERRVAGCGYGFPSINTLDDGSSLAGMVPDAVIAGPG